VRGPDGVKFAILGLIGCHPEGVHGYVLRQQCVRILGHLWQLTFQEVYRVLGHLAAEGWIEASGRDPVAGRKVYSITALGQQSLDAFLLQPTADGPGPRRQELAAKLLFARPEHLPDLLWVINAKRDMYVQQLGILAVQRRKLRRLPVDPFFVNLLIDGAEGSIVAEIDWLTHVSEKLAERFGAPAA
jgi:DNA-binding PadR family transcriptional regulator